MPTYSDPVFNAAMQKAREAVRSTGQQYSVNTQPGGAVTYQPSYSAPVRTTSSAAPVPTPGPTPSGPTGPTVDPYAQIRNDISSAWDEYLGGLEGTSGFIGDQRTAQENIANTQLAKNQGVIQGQRASSLRDIANTTRNAFQAGNNYLGSLGAGDSSGANQYSFAINQQASKQTGDLNNFVNGKMADLQSDHEMRIQGIAQWFAQAQQQLKQQIAEGRLKKGQDLANLSRGILDQAIAATNQIKTNSQNQYNALLEWAASNSANMGQLQQNIAQIPQAMGAIQLGATNSGVGGRPTHGGSGALSYVEDENKPLFGG